MILVVIICLWSVVLALWWWLKPRYPTPPEPPGAWPIIGHAHLLYGDQLYLWKIEKELNKFCLENGGVTLIRLGPVDFYVLTDLDDSLLVANICLDKPYLYKFGNDLYERGLVTANSITWKPDRKILSTKFKQQMLNMFVEDYSAQAKSLLAELESKVGKGPFDVRPYLTKYLLRAVYKTTFGVKTDNYEQLKTVDAYTQATEDLFNMFAIRFQRIWLHLPLIYSMSSWKKKQDVIIDTLKTITNGVITKRKSELKSQIYSDSTKEPTQANFKSLLDVMLDMAIKEDTFTDDEIREHLDTIVAAAYDTTTKAMTFILILVGSHPEVQNRIYKELSKVLGDQDRDLTKHDLPKLVYLEAVIKESIRLYPPVPRIARVSQSELKLKNYTLPAGSIVGIAIYGINRHPMWGADSEQFRPERWLDPATLPDNANAFASFSFGRRNCLGKHYGMMSMKTVLAYILRRYSITADIHKVEITCELLLKPERGHHISLELRS